jgi:hypothetical protein
MFDEKREAALAVETAALPLMPAGRVVQPIERHSGLAVVDDQFLFSEELKRAVAFHVHGVSEIAFHRREHGDDGTALTVVGCVIDLLANRKLRHRKLLLE